MKQCPFCHKSIEDDDIQCRYCDEWLDILEPIKKLKTCPFCQKKIENDEIQCRYCGEWLDVIPASRKKKKNEQVPVEKQRELKKIWDAYGNIIAVIILILVVLIVYKFNQKTAFQESAKQTSKIASPNTDAVFPSMQKFVPAQESVQAQKPVSSRARVEDLVNKALMLCPEGKCADPQKAIEYLDEAVKLDPNQYVAYNNRGIAYSNLGQHRQAIEDYNETIRLKADYANAYCNRGCSYSLLGQHQRAIEDYNESVRLRPDDIHSYYNRAISHLALGNKELGCSDAQKACELGDCKVLERAKSRGICR